MMLEFIKWILALMFGIIGLWIVGYTLGWAFTMGKDGATNRIQKKEVEDILKDYKNEVDNNFKSSPRYPKNNKSQNPKPESKNDINLL